MGNSMNVYISFSNKDKDWVKRLETHLGPIERNKVISVWHGEKIETGNYWREKIDEFVKAATIAILIISPDYLNSLWIMEHEFPLLKDLSMHGQLYIMPVIVRPSVWRVISLIDNFQVFPKTGQPLSLLSEPEIEAEVAELAVEVFHRARDFSFSSKASFSSESTINQGAIEGNIFYQAGRDLKLEESKSGTREDYDLQ